MDYDIKLNDIADDLLILNKNTIDTLFGLDNCSDCIALYMFYYKTAKWQKTNIIKANDLYIKKSLKWGADRIKRTKATLKEHGLIDIVQRRKDGKIEGWYIQVSYLVAQKKTEDIKIKVTETKDLSNNSQNQEVENPTSRFQDTNALKDINKMLKEKNKKEKKETETEFDEEINKEIFNEELKESIYDFIKMRKTIKSPLTTKGLKQLLKRLKLLSNNIEEQIEMINKAILNNWKTVYELTEEDKKLISKQPKEEKIKCYNYAELSQEDYIRLKRKEVTAEQLEKEGKLTPDYL